MFPLGGICRRIAGCSWLLALLASVAAGIGHAQTGLPQEGITIRGFRDMPLASVQLLARSLEPTTLVAPMEGATVTDVLDQRCGDGLLPQTKQVLANEFAALNAEVVPKATLTTRLGGGTTVRVPFCAPVRGPMTVPYVPAANGLEGILKTHYALWGPETQKKASALTDACKGSTPESCSRKLVVGTPITIPFSADWVQGRIKDTASPDSFITELKFLNASFERNLAENLRTQKFVLEYVGLLGAADIKGDDCSENASSDWPMNEGLVLQRMRDAQRTAAKRGTLTRAHVSIIDSGIGSAVFSKYFLPILAWTNTGEKSEDDSPGDNDQNDIDNDLHGIGAAYYGLSGDFFAFEEAADEVQRTHGTQVATAVLGGTSLLEKLLASAETPPFVVSFVRASERIGGVVRPQPHLIPIAVGWLASRKPHVLNVSLRHPIRDDSYSKLYANTLIVAAAGNRVKKDIADITEPQRIYPALMGGMQEAPHVTVGAHDRSFDGAGLCDPCVRRKGRQAVWRRHIICGALCKFCSRRAELSWNGGTAGDQK